MPTSTTCGPAGAKHQKHHRHAKPHGRGALTPTPSLEPEETPTPTPTPTPAPGDFSAVFPTEDTGVDADYSYQSENVRVAVDKVQENEVTYFVADVWVKNIENLRSAFAKGEYGTGITAWPADMAEENNAIVAISGDYYGARQRSVVIRNGVLYREEMLDDICVLYYDGRMETTPKRSSTWKRPLARACGRRGRSAPRCWGKTAKLWKNSIPLFSCAIPAAPSATTSPATTAWSRWTAGRAAIPAHDAGRSFQPVRLFGCKVAYNLDGGATAAMVYEGEVISQPSGGGPPFERHHLRGGGILT